MAKPSSNLYHLTSLSFQPITSNILLYTPPHPSPPITLIILCTWLGATARSISHYCRGYQLHFPHSSILLIRSTIAAMSLHSSAQIHASLKSAREIVLNILIKSDANHANKARILLHNMSHGGCNSALQLWRSLREDMPALSSSSPRKTQDLDASLAGIVFDCCPDNGAFRNAYNAAWFSLPASQPWNAIGSVALIPFVAGVQALQSVGITRGVDAMRRELNEEGVFVYGAPRLYVYSAGDGIVAPEAVEGHARELEEKNVRVVKQRFERAQHCALILEDAERYWRAIELLGHVKHEGIGKESVLVKTKL